MWWRDVPLKPPIIIHATKEPDMFWTKRVGAAAVAVAMAAMAGVQTKGPEIPAFQYDPAWPKPWPNHWTTGNIGALAIDAKDHVWIAHRPASTTSLFERHGLTGE